VALLDREAGRRQPGLDLGRIEEVEVDRDGRAPPFFEVDVLVADVERCQQEPARREHPPALGKRARLLLTRHVDDRVEGSDAAKLLVREIEESIVPARSGDRGCARASATIAGDRSTRNLSGLRRVVE
jgi:hypothetical protein